MSEARGQSASAARIACVIAFGVFGLADASRAADAYTLAEPAEDARVRLVDMQVAIGGKIIADARGGKDLSYDLNAAVDYRFRERRLTGAGRDAEAFRSLRDFERAALETTIGERVSNQSLPRDLSLIVVQGQRSGMLRYSPNELLTRDSHDLLNVPGDPLALIALLPPRKVEVGEEWDVPDWAVQMLTTLEAATSAGITAKLTEVADGVARVEFDGGAEGARQGAVTSIKLTGHFTYDLDQQLIRSVDLTHSEKASEGPATPGIDSQARVIIERSLADNPGALTDEQAAAIPLEPPADRLPLRFDAPEWGLKLFHSRAWHLFHANFDSDPEFVILRMVDEGTIVCQCNFSPVPSAAPGEHTPLEEYEQSIQKSLGTQFAAITARDKIPTQDGRKIFRVTTEGKYTLTDGEKVTDVPMTWIYYLCAAPSGRQVSFVFAVEPSMKERLLGQDRQIVESLQFLPTGD